MTAAQPRKIFVLIAGQFPPPLTGFAYVTQEMTNLIKHEYQAVVIDLSPHRKRGGIFYLLQRLTLTLRGLVPIIRYAINCDPIFYTACEGGMSIVYTIMLCVAARLFGYKIYVHHHSFSYINTHKLLMEILLVIADKPATHIFLCQSMADRFIARYTKPVNHTIISNSAFVPVPRPFLPKPSSQKLVIGLLGHLNNAKGLGIFLDLLNAGAEQGLNITGILAGPVDSNANHLAIEQAQKTLGARLDYRGALYDKAKTQFYRDIDVFVFPTLYANEAQPVVIFEALAHGVPVLSYDRGSISVQVGACGAVLEKSKDFVAFALAWLGRRLSHPESLIQLKQEALAAFVKDNEKSQRQMTQLFTDKTKAVCIDIWHNILWSQYKGEVFSSINKSANNNEYTFRFFQIAESDGNRTSLSDVDLSRHRYPFDLLFKNSYGKIGLWKRLKEISLRTMKSDADLVVLSGYEKLECWAQLLILKIKGRKVVVFCDSTINDRRQRILRGTLKTIFFKNVDGVFGYGARSRDYVLHYGAARDKVYRRCQAAALPQDYTPQKALAARLDASVYKSAPRFLYVGRFSPEKGLNTLLNAFVAVHKQSPQAQLILVGNGNLHDTLKNLVQEKDIAASVIFTGSKSGHALFQEYTQATCLILPSISEPWGLVVNEALAYGCPVIVSDKCGCVPELVIEGKSGFIHKAGDAQDLATKMLASVTAFADTETTANNCINLMSNYTPDKAAAQIIAGCRAVLEKKKHARI